MHVEGDVAWQIIGALALALQAVSVALYRRVDGENKELKEELKRRSDAEAIVNATNAEMAKRYVDLLQQRERPS